MALEEAIKHLEESLSDPGHDWGCEECKGEHEQLLEWLRELKDLREENKVLTSECDRLIKISIHAPRGGSDLKAN